MDMGGNVLHGESKEHLEEQLVFIKYAFENPILEIVGDDERLIEAKE